MGHGTDPSAGRLTTVVASILVAAASVDSHAAVSPPQPPLAVPPALLEPLPEGPRYAVPTRLDGAGRVLAPVMVNGRGPFRFILDTGANRAVLAPRLLEALGLQAQGEGPTLEVHGVTGSAALPSVQLAELKAGELTLVRDQRVPVLGAAMLAQADGILGIEGLSSARIEIDFADDQVVIERSNGRKRAPEGYLTVEASLRHGGLLMVPGRVGKVRVKAIIDTGAERTLGNEALRLALQRSMKHDEGEGRTRTVLGATPAVHQGTALIAPTIYLGDAELRDLEVTFGNLHVFRIWDLEQEPALLIGMDLLGTVERLVIDYRRREVQLKPRS